MVPSCFGLVEAQMHNSGWDWVELARMNSGVKVEVVVLRPSQSYRITEREIATPRSMAAKSLGGLFI